MSSQRGSSDVSKRPSVFERLGTKPGVHSGKGKRAGHGKSSKGTQDKHDEKHPKEGRILSKKSQLRKDSHTLQDNKKKKVRHARSSSSSSSSSASSSSSSDSSSSSSSSSSSEEEQQKKRKKRRRSADSHGREKSSSPSNVARRDKKKVPGNAKKAVKSRKAVSPNSRSHSTAKKRRISPDKVKPLKEAATSGYIRGGSCGRKRSRSRDKRRTPSPAMLPKRSISPVNFEPHSPRLRSPTPRSRRRSPSPPPRYAAGGGGAGGGGVPRRQEKREPRRRTPERDRRSCPRNFVRGSNFDHHRGQPPGLRDAGSRDRAPPIPPAPLVRSPGRLSALDRGDRGSRDRDRKERRPSPLPMRSESLRRSPVDRGMWDGRKSEDRRRREDPRERNWERPGRLPPVKYEHDMLPYEEPPLLPPRNFSPPPRDGRRPMMGGPMCEGRSTRPPYGRIGDDRRSMDRMMSRVSPGMERMLPRGEEWLPPDESLSIPPLPPHRGAPRPPPLDWSPQPPRGGSGGFRRQPDEWGRGGWRGAPRSPPPGPRRQQQRQYESPAPPSHSSTVVSRYLEMEADSEPPPDPGDMIVRDEVRSDDAVSAGEELVSPGRRDGVGSVASGAGQSSPSTEDVKHESSREVRSSVIDGHASGSTKTEERTDLSRPALDCVSKPAAAPLPPLALQTDSLSDFSDDADEILNREDEAVEEEVITFDSDSAQDTDRNGSQCSGSPGLDRSRTTPDREQIVKDLDAMVEKSAEAVADEGLIDSLTVDWSSLVSTKPQRSSSPQANSALQRFAPREILSRLGVCREWAGPELMAQLQNLHAGSTEELNGAANWPPDVVGRDRQSMTRRSGRVITDPCPYSRAVSARSDLALRRRLCHVSEVEPLPDHVAVATLRRAQLAKHMSRLSQVTRQLA